jgi:ABC-type glycerol-3-phosphate transport system permease component
MAYVALLLIPSTLTLIPLFLTIQKLGLFNTWWALILPYAATAQPLLVLIFRGFFDQIPRELLESARTDGCTEAQVLARIVAPLTRPVLLTGAILVTINVWGDYLWPTIVIQDPHKTTISAGLQQFVSSFGLNVSSGGSVFAALVIATLPMFVLVGFTMRYFVSGLTEGATKL